MGSFRPSSAARTVAFVAVISVSRAGCEGLAVEFFLISVAAEVVLFFEQEPIFAAKEIGGGEACDSATNDDDVGLRGGGRKIEVVAVAKLVADFEMFALDARRSDWFGI